MDRLNHLKRLSRINSSKSIRFLTPIAHPGSHCPMHTAVSIAACIKDMSSIVLGARECAFYSRGVPHVAESGNGLHWSYVMDSNEVVFGCKDGLIKAIKELDAQCAGTIAVIATCVPEIIGEDLDGIISEAQPQVKAKLLGVKAPQFSCNGSTTGGLLFYESMLALMEKKDRKPRTVNLLGYDPAVFRRQYPPKLLPLLHEAGLDVRYFYASEATVRDYANTPEASMNLVFSLHNIGLARLMEEHYGIPYIMCHDLYSVNDWDVAINKLEEVFGIELAPRFAPDREKALTLENEVRAKLNDRTFIMTFPYRDTLPLAAYLAELGMVPLLIHADEFNPHNARWAERILDAGHDPYICHMVNDRADARVLNALEYDICVGRFKYAAGDRPCMQDMSDLLLSYEYARTVALLEMLIQTEERTYGAV